MYFLIGDASKYRTLNDKECIVGFMFGQIMDNKETSFISIKD